MARAIVTVVVLALLWCASGMWLWPSGDAGEVGRGWHARHSGQTPPAAGIVVEGAAFLDLGEIPIETLRSVSDSPRLARTFTIVNHHPHSVAVERITTSCSCADARRSADELAPGGRLDVELSVDLVAATTLTPAVLVLFDDGSVVRFGFTVRGTSSCEISPGWRVAFSEGDDAVEIELLGLGDGCAAEQSPELLDPDVGVLTFSGWSRVVDAVGDPSPLHRGTARFTASGPSLPLGVRISCAHQRTLWISFEPLRP